MVSEMGEGQRLGLWQLVRLDTDGEQGVRLGVVKSEKG